MFKGSFVALVTPFKDGKIHEKKLHELVEWHISEGTDGLVPVGTTGEATTLSYEEHLRVIQVVAEAARKRVPVIAGTGSNATNEALTLSEEAIKVGADALLLVNPYYNKPTQEGLKAHFGELAKRLPVPIVLYNIPSRTGVNLLPDTLQYLVSHYKNIVAVKDATGNLDQASEVMLKTEGQPFVVFSGEDSMTLPLMSLGAVGVVSVVGNLVPRLVKTLCQSAMDKNFDKAREIHLKLFPLIKALFIETNPAPVKAAMKETGLIEDDSLRLPLVSVTEEHRAIIKNVIKNFDIKPLVAVK